MNTQRYCLACDLKNDPQLIEEYKNYHAAGKVWPAVQESIKASGIVDMQIYLTGNRLFMIMEVDESFSFERKSGMDAENDDVQQWEQLMWHFQQALPWAEPGEKWVQMESIFRLGAE